MTPQCSGRQRRSVPACLAFAVASVAAALVCSATPVRADAACSSASACPRIEAVSPALLTSVPTRPLDLTLRGSGFAGIRDATLVPGGVHLRVVSPGETSMMVEVPVGALAIGQSYRVQLSVGNQPNDTVQSPPIALVTAAGTRAPISLEPAPTVPPTAKPVVRAVTAAAPPAPASSGSSVVGGLLIWLVGLLVGGGACIVFAIRTGLIRESRWASLVLDRFATSEVPALHAPPPARLQTSVRRPVAPTWTLAPGSAEPASPTWALTPASTERAHPPTRDGPSAEATTTQPGRPAWGIREQSKPDGVPTRLRTSPH